MVTLNYWDATLRLDSDDDGEFVAFTVDAGGTIQGLGEDLSSYGFGGMLDGRLRIAGEDFSEPYFTSDEPLELRIGDYVVAISQRGFKLEGDDERLRLYNRDDDEYLAYVRKGKWQPIVTDGKTFSDQVVICPVEFVLAAPLLATPLGPRSRLSALAV